MNFNSKLLKLIAISLYLLSLSTLALADVPLTTKDPDTQICIPTLEVCSDGVDGDCDGVDPKCEGVSDADQDGYASSSDCDDNDLQMFPGEYASCQASCGYGLKQCGGSGSYGACTCQPVCEAVGSGKCYYISSSHGLNTNAGSFYKPWKDFSNITYNEEASQRPTTFKQLGAGDVVYLMGSVYTGISQKYARDNDAMLQLSFLKGSVASPIVIKAYPNSRAVLSPASKRAAILIRSSEYISIEGLEVTKAFGEGIQVNNSSDINLQKLKVHNNDGVDNHNPAGIYIVSSRDVDISHSYIYDNYDRIGEDTNGVTTENARNIVAFGGGNIHIHNNVIFHSKSIDAKNTGACIVYKHTQTIENGKFEVNNNIFWHCKYDSIGSGTNHTRIHHNLIIDSDVLTLKNFGGYTNLSNILIEKNTFINSRGLYLKPDNTYNPMGYTYFKNNIVMDTKPYRYEQNLIDIGTYNSDVFYNDIKSKNKVQLENNCYFNSATPGLRFGFFEDSAPGRELGQAYTFVEWQTQGFDSSSHNINPNFTSPDFISKVPECSDKGWRTN